MKNCLIMGCGRSGSSMIAGIFHDAGYYMGNNLYKPRHSNPKGFFENAEINGINEKILSKYDRPLESLMQKFSKKTTVYRPKYGQRWLMSIPVNIRIDYEDEEIKKRITEVVNNHTHFCYKDPRFSYTLPVWKKYLNSDIIYICIFRNPDVTVNSILKECASVNYLKSLKINQKVAFEVWESIYSHILERHLESMGNFVFVHYNQVYDGSALTKLSEKIGHKLKHGFASRKLNRSKAGLRISLKTENIYNRLCELANYSKQ